MMNIVMLIWPGFYKVNATSNPQALVFASAYKKDSRVVIVAINLNSFSVNQKFIIQNGFADSFVSYVTSKIRTVIRRMQYPFQMGVSALLCQSRYMVGSGIYCINLQIENQNLYKKMVLIR